MRRKKFEADVLLLLGSIAISLEKIAHPIVVMPDDEKLGGGRHTTRSPRDVGQGGPVENPSRSPRQKR